MNWVALNDGAFPYAYAGVHLDQMLDRIGMTEVELFATLDQFTNWDLFERGTHRTVCLKAA
jgi:hypothetical protein